MDHAETTLLLADLLRSGHDVRVRVTGRSMAPALRDGDTVTVCPVRADAVRLGDVVFAVPTPSEPLLHRVIARQRPSRDVVVLVTKGDALADPDAPLAAGCVLGRVRAVARTSAKTDAPDRRLDTPASRAQAGCVAIAGRWRYALRLRASRLRRSLSAPRRR